MIFLDFLLNLLLFKFGKRAICIKKALSFAYLPLIYPLSTPYLPLIYPLSIAYPSSHTRLCQLADFPSLILRHILGCASSPTFLRLSFAYPSLILRLSFAYLSLIYRLSTPYLSLIYPLSIPYLPLIYHLSFVTYSAVPARRLSFAGKNFEF